MAMADPVPGPLGLCRPKNSLEKRNIFSAFDNSDEENDFGHIPHISDHEDSYEDDDSVSDLDSDTDNNGNDMNGRSRSETDS